MTSEIEPALIEARERVARANDPSYASEILDGGWDNKPAILKTLSEVRHQGLAPKDVMGGGLDPRDIAIELLERQVADLRSLLRRVTGSDGEGAAVAIAEATRELDGLEAVDREIEFDRFRDDHYAATHCSCGTMKGAGTSYCPECDADTLARFAERRDAGPSNVAR